MRCEPRTHITSPRGKLTCSRYGTVHASARLTGGSCSNWQICAPHFRWAADHDDIDSAATIATYAAFLGTLVEQYAPLGWAEELIEPARALQHRRLAALHTMATQVYLIGRIDDAIRHSESTVQCLTSNGHFDDVPFGHGTYHGSPYIATGQPERWADACRLQLEL